MYEFDRNLLHNSEIVDAMLNSLGGETPRKRLLIVDYKENGVDKNINLAAYQYGGVTDADLTSNLIIGYVHQGKMICSIVEVGSDGQPIQQLYLKPGYLKECLEEFIISQRKGTGDRL